MSNWNPKIRRKCRDCGVLEGQRHENGCDMERCPFCLGQNISCSCRYAHFYPNYKRPKTLLEMANLTNTNNLPQEVYENGLSKDQEKEWNNLCNDKGRIPYIVLPNLCARCGETWPDLFMTDDWEQAIPRDAQKEILCLDCYNTIKAFVLLGKEESNEK